MYKENRVLAIIPARGGSKRLPGKNIMSISGKPLLAWTIEAAKKSKIFDDIILTTDDIKIAEIGQTYGASVPFLRRKDLATDKSSSTDVILDVLNWCSKEKLHYDIMVLLQPTSPLRSGEDIYKSMEVFMDKNADAVISVTEVEHPIQWCGTIDDSLSMKNFIDNDIKNLRSQDLKINYRINGAIYISKISSFKEHHSFYLDKSYSYIMDKMSSIDIDDKYDFIIAETIMNIQKENI